MSSNAIVLSIRPQYAEKIFKGTKTVELRRVRPRYIEKGGLVLLYISSPIQSLAGAFKVEEIVEKPLGELWKQVQEIAGVTKAEFDQYFHGVENGIGIFFKNPWRLSEPIKIKDWAERGISFQPPQGFRYATVDELATPQIANLVKDHIAEKQYSFLK